MLILASQSPRRRALLASLGVLFTVVVADADETPLPGESPDALVERLSRLKAAAIAKERPDCTILAADTVVALDGSLLGKPVDAAEACAMLRVLRGRAHQVHTAVTVVSSGYRATELSTSHVTMHAYGEEQIVAYVATGDPLDKAGAYAIQHPGFAPVRRWEGCYSAIMGLPLGVTARLLRAAGVRVPEDAAQACRRLSVVCCLDHLHQ